MFRVEASLLYFNTDHVRATVWDTIRSAACPVKLVIIDLSNAPSVDMAGARMLATLHADLTKAGAILRLVAAHGSVRDMLRAEGLEQQVGDISRRVSADDVIATYLHEVDSEATVPAAPASKTADGSGGAGHG